MTGNFDDWATWKAKTGFHRQVQASLEKHRVSRNVTPEEYITSKRTQLAQELEGKILIYLDTKHWVNMCNVVVQSKHSLPIYGEVLGQLENLRQKKRICCPVSSTLFEELMKQSDTETRQATARIMDFFSGGVCLRNWLALAQAEFAIHICRTFGIEESKRPTFSSWTKIGYWAGEHTFQFPNLPAEESTAMEKLYIDLSWDMSLEHYEAMPDRIPTPDVFEIAWAKEAERSQADQTVVKSSFTKLVRQKRRQLLSALKENLIPMMSVCKNMPGNPNDHVSAALDPIYGGLDPKAVPSLEVIA